jgi:hypothetical protein
MRWLAVILLLGLTACSGEFDWTQHRRHHRMRVEHIPEPVAPEKTETHDEMVDRVHRESMQRRKEYCDRHPNLSVRIGCE